MALLIVALDKHIGSAKTWRDTFAPNLPDLAIRIQLEGRTSTTSPSCTPVPTPHRLPDFHAMFGRSAVL